MNFSLTNKQIIHDHEQVAATVSTLTCLTNDWIESPHAPYNLCLFVQRRATVTTHPADIRSRNLFLDVMKRRADIAQGQVRGQILKILREIIELSVLLSLYRARVTKVSPRISYFPPNYIRSTGALLG